MKKISGYIFTPEGTFRYGQVTLDKGKITQIEYLDESDGGCEESLMILPGLVDIHLHGAYGGDITSGKYEDFDTIASYEGKHGVAAFLGATMTLAGDTLKDISGLAGEYYRKQPVSFEMSGTGKARFEGLFLEGPFISPLKCGAQKMEHVKSPDVNLVREINNLSGNIVRLVLVAPETDGAIDFITEMTKDGIKCTIGHTAADYESTVKAMEAGARHGTHLFNAMTPLNHREPGVSGAFLTTENTTLELIADGNHLHPAVIKLVFDIKKDHEAVLVSDSMMATGLEDGRYTLGEQPVIKNGNEARMTDGTLAGSVTDLYDCMVNTIKAGVEPKKAIMAATINPARVAGISEEFGTVEVGKRGFLLLVDGDWRLRKVID